ncbi:MAG: hypothetical protein M3Y49_05370, partial [Actinomycetota bacterium]|nr:hypothetical protein [Actinomycetota bacterium]
VQPFLVTADLASGLGEQTHGVVLTSELRDTYGLYEHPNHVQVVWLSETQFGDLSRPMRTFLVRAQHTFGRELVPSVRAWDSVVGDPAHTQADGHRFVWWPSLIAGHEELVLKNFVEEHRRASRHDDVTPGVWRAVNQTLPGAQRLAGTFAHASGLNCFGMVMAAAGGDHADTQGMLREPFEDWLWQNTRPGGGDTEVGTVLVWRSVDGLVQHAAVTLGQGWVLHKPSQGWMSPVKVLTLGQYKASSRVVGHHLERHSLLA